MPISRGRAFFLSPLSPSRRATARISHPRHMPPPLRSRLAHFRALCAHISRRMADLPAETLRAP